MAASPDRLVLPADAQQLSPGAAWPAGAGDETEAASGHTNVLLSTAASQRSGSLPSELCAMSVADDSSGLGLGSNASLGLTASPDKQQRQQGATAAACTTCRAAWALASWRPTSAR